MNEYFNPGTPGIPITINAYIALAGGNRSYIYSVLSDIFPRFPRCQELRKKQSWSLSFGKGPSIDFS
jgi:hypothetical protein